MEEDDLKILVSEQQRELMAAKDIISDFDLAFRLQMQEALNASLALQPSTSSAPKPSSLIDPQLISDDDEEISQLTNLQTLELEKFQQERKDREHCEGEMNKLSDDLKRRIHDQNFAREILMFPEKDWENHGEYFEKPFGEGSSSNPVTDEPFRLYFRGLVSEEIVKGSKVMLSAMGAAICDPQDNLLLKIQKPLIGDWKSHRFVEVKALIEGLNAALSLNIKRINVYCDYFPLFKQLTGRWNIKQNKMKTLINQVFALQRKFISCRPFLLARNDVKFAIKLARDAIDSQITRSVESSSQANNMNETCNICLEDTDVSQMFSVDGCLHRYCFSCMKQHIEVKLLHGMVPGCPHEGCKIQLKVDNCRKFLTPKFVEMMSQRIKEASVPVTEKLYCPYPKCSALMSKSEVTSSNDLFGSNRSGARKCIKCHGLFCINCKVPWHSGVSCYDYKRLNPRGEEAKLKFLASEKLWRQCVKCNHMIELAEGCYHMTCRCGYEFCYTCGAEWKNKKATCSCPLWAEENILYDEDTDEDFEEDDYDDSDYDDWVTDDEDEFHGSVW
ncbi:zinc finger protein [Macleaya cordata]|uniref:RBR-type E3 ubiquitin transferase n=1 Tax=Macleaya cordata TaxID=56857 RepID=A0A200R636_MACCD|nr:zinc finger protein [Macleaya cordata]